MATNKEVFSIIVDKDTLRFIEDYRYQNGLRSKSASAVELLLKGIEVEKQTTKQERMQDNEKGRLCQRLEKVSD